MSGELQINVEQEIKRRRKRTADSEYRKILISTAAANRIEAKISSEAKTNLNDVLTKIILKVSENEIEREVKLCERIAAVKENMKDEYFKEALFEIVQENKHQNGVN